MFKIWFERALPPQYAHFLKDSAEIIAVAANTPEDPFGALPEAQALVVGVRYEYDGAVMDQAPKLQAICRTGVGYDNIIVRDATERGIIVCNTPDAPTISTAEHTIMLMLAVTKCLKTSETAIRAGKKDLFNEFKGIELFEKSMGIVGLGRVGGHVAKIAAGLGMRVMAYDPHISAETAALKDATLVESLEELFNQADILSLHLPYTPESRHLINAETLKLMKPGSYLINCGRGGLIDEAALLEALESGHLAGVGLDVFDPEPPQVDNPLLKLEQVVATPHISSATDAGRARLWGTAINQAIQVLRGEQPPHAVNLEAWPPKRR